MASALGLPVGDYLRRTTARQHRLWVAWLDEQQNVPSRADWYAIQASWLQLDPQTRPPMERLKIEFGQIKPTRPEDEPFPRLTREDVGRIRMAIRKAELEGKRGR